MKLIGPDNPCITPPADPSLAVVTARRSRGRRLILALAVLGGATLMAVVWCLAARPAGAQGSDGGAVDIIDFGFDQTRISVPAGTTVTWTNTGARPHTATDRGGTFDTQPINPGENASITLSAPGTYFYFCRINPSKMNGIIDVEPGPSPAPVVRVQTVDPANIEGESLRFDPPQLEVRAGTELQIANVGGKPHSLTADSGAFNSGILQPGPEAGRFAGSSATITLATAGTFTFFCEIHPQAMRGTVIVTGSPPSSSESTVARPPPTTTPPPAPAVAATTAAIAIIDFSFDAAQVSVAPDAAVTFRNAGQAPHTATFDDVQLDTGTLDSGATATLAAPTQPGSYSYFCAIHSRMRGVLVVLGAGTVDPVSLPVASGGNPTPTTDADGDDASGATTSAPVSTEALAAGRSTGEDSGGSSSLMTGWVLVTIVVGVGLAAVGGTLLFGRRSSSPR